MSSILEDKDAIRDLIAQYCFHLDHQEWDPWIELFTEDGVFDAEFLGVAQGRAQLREFIDGIVPRPNEGLGRKHIMSNVLVTVDGDKATASSYYLLVTGDKSQAFIGGAGRYYDSFERVGGRWLIKHRRVTHEIVGTLALKR